MSRSLPDSTWLDATGQPVVRMPDALLAATNGVVFDERGQVLLQRRADNGWWGLPGGLLDIGESLEEGAVREVLEETGLSTHIKRLVGIYSDPKYHNIMPRPDGNKVQTVTAVFECECISGELQVSEESTDVAYFHTDALPENTLLGHRIQIADAMENRPLPFLK